MLSIAAHWRAILNRSRGFRGLFQDRFESRPFGFHADVTIVLQHLLGHVTGDVHDGLIPGAVLGQLRDESVPVVVPAPADFSVDTQVPPGGLQ